MYDILYHLYGDRKVNFNKSNLKRQPKKLPHFNNNWVLNPSPKKLPKTKIEKTYFKISNQIKVFTKLNLMRKLMEIISA
jgi:hypothetical protein